MGGDEFKYFVCCWARNKYSLLKSSNILNLLLLVAINNYAGEVKV